jgi:hypothetical protein
VPPRQVVFTAAYVALRDIALRYITLRYAALCSATRRCASYAAVMAVSYLTRIENLTALYEKWYCLAREVRRRMLKEQTKVYSGEEGFGWAGLVEGCCDG